MVGAMVMSRRVFVAALAAISLFISAYASAETQCTLPYQLTNSTLSDSTQLVANFKAVANCIKLGGSTNAIQFKTCTGQSGGVRH
jgi:hypothetical protein